MVHGCDLADSFAWAQNNSIIMLRRFNSTYTWRGESRDLILMAMNDSIKLADKIYWLLCEIACGNSCH